jgi:hypothetical protein
LIQLKARFVDPEHARMTGAKRTGGYPQAGPADYPIFWKLANIAVRLRVVRFTPSRSDTIGCAGDARKVSFACNFLRFGAVVLRWIKAGDRPR